MRKEGSDIDLGLHTFPEPMADVTVTTAFEQPCPIQRQTEHESFIQTLEVSRTTSPTHLANRATCTFQKL